MGRKSRKDWAYQKARQDLEFSSFQATALQILRRQLIELILVLSARAKLPGGRQSSLLVMNLGLGV